MKSTNKLFSSYDAYLRRQVAKVKRAGQRERGGIRWEYNTQRDVKPKLVKWLLDTVGNSIDNVLVLGARWGADVLFLQESKAFKHINAFDLYDPPLTDLVQVGDVHSLDVVANNSIDLVWAYHVFEHFWSPSHVLREMHDKCVSSAHMFIALPDFGIEDKYDAQDEFVDKESWEKLCADNGWIVKAYDSYKIKPKKRAPAHFYVFVRDNSWS